MTCSSPARLLRLTATSECSSPPCHYELQSALAELSIAALGSPNDPEIAISIGSVLRRQGAFEDALAEFEKALRLAPDDARTWWDTGSTYGFLRQYEKANRYYERSISLAPDQWQAYYHQLLYLGWFGALEERQHVDGRPIYAFICTVGVDDVDETARRIEAAGGTVTMPKTEIPTVGWLIQFTDTEGNVVSAMKYHESAR